jgi:hypothetical protein
MRILISVFAAVSALAQPGVVAAGGERVLVTVPMVGSGTWNDPKRPAMLREARVPFRFVLSDDGNTAIVLAAPRGPLETKTLEERLRDEPRAKVFRPAKDREADVVTEVRKLKKDFDLSELGALKAAKTN